MQLRCCVVSTGRVQRLENVTAQSLFSRIMLRLGETLTSEALSQSNLTVNLIA